MASSGAAVCGTVDLLVALDAYSNGERSIGVANAAWKKSVFALTKANRCKGRAMVGMEPFYSPEMVREDLQATVRVRLARKSANVDDECDCAPELADESDGSENEPSHRVATEPPSFVLSDVSEDRRHAKLQQTAKKQNVSQTTAGTAPSTTNRAPTTTGQGLRQRKSNTVVSNDVSKHDTHSFDNADSNGDWTIVEEELPHKEPLNPIDLFGAFPPQDLKIAQKQAQEALRGYVQAANCAAKILHLLNSQQN